MAKTIRSPEVAVNNWVNRTSAATNFYVQQVQAAAWKVYAASNQAEANFATAMQQVIANKSRQAGINASSDEAWKQGVATLGAQRYPQGVSAAQPKMAAVMNKLIPAIDQIRKSLPPRGVAGSQENINRMVNFVTGLHKQKGQFKARGVPK
ncbi:hypothetical protein [Metallosphaera sp.]|uniref:hypothetical protein n=1 Tax=Metallosphaera sp. TaxID=2020860 RepID=UPI0031818B94